MNLNYDVAVVGGGFAGIAAALSSARLGKKTVLLESTFTLGGLATSGLVCYYLPICDGVGHQVMLSIPYELFLLSLKEGYEEKYPAMWFENRGSKEERMKDRFENKFNPSLFACLAEKLLIENGVEIFYGVSLSSAKVENGRIQEIELVSRLDHVNVIASSFIDCTGDATLAAYAGEKTENVPSKNVPTSWYWAVKDGKYELRQRGATDYVFQATAKKEDTHLGLDFADLSQMMVSYHQSVMSDFLKEGKDSPSYILSTMATIPEIRMTRKVVSCQDLRLEDDHKYQKDSVGLFGDWTKAGPIYEMPFGSLMGKRIKNLTVAGRCLGVNDMRMWNVTRTIPVCALSGEACGVIAAVASEKGAAPIEDVQAILAARGVPLHIEDLHIKD